MIEKIKNEISKNSVITDWKLKEIEENSRQFYFINVKKECEKNVSEKRYLLTIYVDKDKKRGESTVTIQSEDDIKRKIENAVLDASLGLNPLYFLPEKSEYPILKINEKEEPERFIEEFFMCIKEEKNIKLSSFELFQTQRNIRLLNSRGIDFTFDEVSNYFEFVVIAKSKDIESESHIELPRRRLKDINLKEIVKEVSKRAIDSLNTTLPKTGKFNVVISGSDILDLFTPIIFHTSGEAIYKKISLLEKDKEWIKESKYDKLTLYGNAIMDYGNNSYPCDDDGVPNRRNLIIEDGVFKNIWASKKYADYLNIEPLGSFGNIEVITGETKFEDLLKDEKPIYHIVEFSAGLWPDVYTGNFGGEIRLGYEVYKDNIKVVKGGSIRGNIFSCFSSALFSKEEEFYGSYKGPKGIKFFDLTVAGG